MTLGLPLGVRAADVFQAVLALFDVVCDAAVAYEFYRAGRTAYFALSLGVFFVAQLVYAFYFVSTWAAHLKASAQIWAFFLVLPVAQLVPLFAFFEALHVAWIDRRIRELGLRPRRHSAAASSSAARSVSAPPPHRSSWEELQQKHAGAAGFMLEALAEAIPQALLQTAALVTAPGGVAGASRTMQFSIALSILCVASKSYLISFSIDARTYAFNCACVAADVFALFATTTWLFELAMLPPGGPAYDALPRLLSLRFAVRHVHAPALALFALGTAAACAFAVCDDHLKVIAAKRSRRWANSKRCRRIARLLAFKLELRERLGAGPVATRAARSEIARALADETVDFYADADVEAEDVVGDAALEAEMEVMAYNEKSVVVWYDLYLVRFVLWLLALLPLIVVHSMVRWTCFPVALFRSLNPEHGARSAFYAPLLRFILGRDRDAPALGAAAAADAAAAVLDDGDSTTRLNTANRCLIAASAMPWHDRIALQQAGPRGIARWTQRIGYGVTHWRDGATRRSSGSLLQGWRRTVTGGDSCVPARDDELASLLEARFDDDPTENEVTARAKVGRLNVARGAQKQLRTGKHEVLRRSYMLRLCELRGARRSLRDALMLLRSPVRRVEGMLRVCGMLALGAALLSCAAWLPILAVSMMHSALLPLFCALRWASSGGALAAWLTATNVLCIGAAALLAKRTWQFQRVLRVDLVDCSDLPPPVYEHGYALVKEIVLRYKLRRVEVRRDSYVRRKLPSDCARRVASFVERPMKSGPRQEGGGLSWSEEIYVRLTLPPRDSEEGKKEL